MKKKAIVLAIAGALATPSAFAAQDTSGMQYTSASEGFYASIRAAYDSGQNEDATSQIEDAFSRFGVRGTNDLGGGLEGFYQYEAAVSINNGGGLRTRLGQVGLRGTFGEAVFGSIWANAYNWVYGVTDIANYGSGNFAYVGRASNVVQYTSPDLSGFQGSFMLNMVGGNDDNDLDEWTASAQYAFGGLTAAGSYSNAPDSLITITNVGGVPGTGVDDANNWAIRLGYGQDNWNVNGWYGADNSGDISDEAEDVKTTSLSGVMSVNQTSFYVVWENQDSGVDNSAAIFGVQYDLGVNSRVWAEYVARDDDTPGSTVDDYVSIGLRHDF
ncbi:MAG: porin [Gammaproteobacteria bacterium]